MRASRRSGPGRSKIGLALAGGGPEGGVYEVGALCALEESLEGIDFSDLHVYVGVSAGSFVAACLANGMSGRQLCLGLFERDPRNLPLRSSTFFTPAYRELSRRALMTPGLIWDSLREYAESGADRNLLGSLTRLTRALPVGVFDNEPIRAYLEGAFTSHGRTDDFRELARPLIVVATDLDSGQAVKFGEAGLDHVPISRAVQASTALPVLYPPVEIDGRSYVDGVLLKTLHASVAMDAGAELLICLNPIVPVDTGDSVAAGVMRRGKLTHRGLPAVLSQTFRTLVHSRLAAGMANYEPRYPDTDLILLEPDPADYKMFFTNIFKFSNRQAVCEHAYHAMRRQLLARHEELQPILERHGARLRVEVLEEPREFLPGLGIQREPQPAPPSTVVGDLNRTLNRLEGLLLEAES